MMLGCFYVLLLLNYVYNYVTSARLSFSANEPVCTNLHGDHKYSFLALTLTSPPFSPFSDCLFIVVFPQKCELVNKPLDPSGHER